MGISREIEQQLESLHKIQLALGISSDAVEVELNTGGGGGGFSLRSDFDILQRNVSIACDKVERLLVSRKGSSSVTMAKLNYEIRESLTDSDKAFLELQKMCIQEHSKRRSRCSPQELTSWDVKVDMLRERIEALKLCQFEFLEPTNKDVWFPFSYSTKQSSRFKETTSQRPQTGAAEEQDENLRRVVEETMTTSHISKLYMISNQENKQDGLLNQIEETVSRIGYQAKGMREEMIIHSKELKECESKIEASTAHVTMINEELKYVLKEVDSNGNFVTSILCLVLLLGMCGLFYKIIRNDISTR